MTAEDASSLTGRRVLLVDDDPADGYAYKTAMARAGAEVSIVTDGRFAVAASESGYPFDLVVLALVLPGIRGTEIAALLRGGGFAGAIVGTAAVVTTELEELWLAAGCDAVARKADDGLAAFLRLVADACDVRPRR